MSAEECSRFLRNPLTYVRDVCISLQVAGGHVGTGGFDANKSYTPCWFDLDPFSKGLFGGVSQVVLKPQTAMGAGLIQGYYVPYISYGNVASTAADHIDPVLLDAVPKVLPPYRFVFTGGQNGCSLLMLKGSTADMVSFLHYPNSDGKAKGYPLLGLVGKSAADVLVSIDFDMYGEKLNPNACSFFFHDGKEWVGVTQPQVQGAIDLKQMRPSMSLNRNRPPMLVSATRAGPI